MWSSLAEWIPLGPLSFPALPCLCSHWPRTRRCHLFLSFPVASDRPFPKAAKTGHQLVKFLCRAAKRRNKFFLGFRLRLQVLIYLTTYLWLLADIRSWFLLSVYSVPRAVKYFIASISLMPHWSWNYYCFHFTDKCIEASRLSKWPGFRKLVMKANGRVHIHSPVCLSLS